MLVHAGEQRIEEPRCHVVNLGERVPQKTMRNSYHQARNLDGAFAVAPDAVPEGPVLLVGDMTDAKWTFTVIGALLREAGSGPVHPFALAYAGGA